MSPVMRRRTILLAAGLLAYLTGASVRAYLSCLDGLRVGGGDVSFSVFNVVRHPRVAFNQPILTAQYLVGPVCND